MKKLYLILFVIISLKSVSNTDTLYSNISALQAYDTIQYYNNNPYFVILDVRTPSEYVTHIAGAVNINFYDSNFSLILDSLNKNKVYLIHCASGGRSSQVFTLMQNKHFRTVYNMTGGINSWNASALPTTTSVLPKLGLLTDSILTFNTTVGNKDSILITLTNCKNSILHVINYTDLTGTNFSSSITNVSILGARDYCFYIYFNPVTLNNDSVLFTIETDNGTQNIYVYGNASQTNIENVFSDNNIFKIKKIFNELNIEASYRIQNLKIYNISGNTLYNKSINSNFINFNTSGCKSGIYIIEIIIQDKIYLRKIIL